MKLSRTNFELLLLGIIASPFIYLGLNWVNSAEIKENNHNSLYVGMGIILISYFSAMFGELWDKLNKKTSQILLNSRTMRLIMTVFGAVEGFVIFHKNLEFGHQTTNLTLLNFIWMPIFSIIWGNYQYRMKPSSAFGGWIMPIFSDKVQMKNNRIQGRLSVALGVLGVITFVYFQNSSNYMDIFLWYCFMIFICLISSIILAVFTTPKTERFSKI